jgi:Spy/CpxP family protein refolding chaperone
MNRIALSLGATAAALAFLAVSPGMNSGARLLAQDSTSKPTPAVPATPATPASPSMGQGPELPPEFRPLFDGITLTDVQNRQIATIAQKYATPPAGRGSDSSKAGMGAGAVDQRMAAAKEFRTVLTPDQQKIYDKNLDKVKSSWGKRSN